MFAFSFCVFAFLGIHLVYSHTVDACRYPYRKIGKSCYLISKERVTWDTAFVKCLKYGAYLAAFETFDELMLIKYELHRMNTDSSFFVGGRNINRHISGGDWRWIKHGQMTKMTYFAFDAVQPNGSSRYPQDCLSLNGRQRYSLYDDYCDSYSIGFICEK